MDYSTIQTNIMVINSYMEIIKSSSIIDKVIHEYPDLCIMANDLASNIKASTTNESLVMTLNYQDPSYEVASKIVNAIAMVFEKQILNIMKVDNVTILSSAQITDEAIPLNINPVMVIIIGFIMGLMLAIGLVLLLD
ncbi:hypothetical protein PMSM_06125 [Paenibacillus macquariensis subsp. macquariensis]|nr:hypothetical protein PMSM_06125 [Paenibacillus macquariensis subsp. macquariensis]